MSNTVARAMSQDCFCVKETTKGTAIYPTAATERVVTAGTAEINQQASFSDSEEVVNSLDVMDRFQDQMGAGTWSVPIYIRTSGTKGTPPMGKILYESLMGLETIVTDTSVTYEQATTKPSFTIWMRKSHTVFYATGACTEAGKLNFTNKGGSKVDFSGGFMRMGWAGTSAANGATANGSGSGYLTDHAQYPAGTTSIHLDTGTGTVLEGDTVTFAGDLTVYFVETGCAGDGDSDITIRAPGLTTTLDEDVAMTITGSSKITLDSGGGKLYTAGTRIEIGADNNTNAGYEIASVTVASDKLFMAEAVTCADNAEITGFLPTYTAVGTVLENKNLAITFDGTSKNLKSLSVDVNSPVAWQTDEITTSGYVTEYIEDRRAIKCSLDVLFREQDVSYFYDATQNTQVSVIAINDGGAGDKCTINIPQTELEVPQTQTSSPTVSLSIAGTGLGSTGEDSCSIVFE